MDTTWDEVKPRKWRVFSSESKKQRLDLKFWEPWDLGIVLVCEFYAVLTNPNKILFAFANNL